jgi:hypothetical protein
VAVVIRYTTTAIVAGSAVAIGAAVGRIMAIATISIAVMVVMIVPVAMITMSMACFGCRRSGQGQGGDHCHAQ